MLVKRILYGVDEQGVLRECRCRIPADDETDEAIASVPQDVLIDAIFRATGNRWSLVSSSEPIPGMDGVRGPSLPFASLDRSEIHWSPPTETPPLLPPPSEMRRRRTIQQVVVANDTAMTVMATDGTLWELRRHGYHVDADDGDVWVQLPDLPQD